MSPLTNMLRRATLRTPSRVGYNWGTRMMHTHQPGSPKRHWAESDLTIYTLTFGIMALSGQLLEAYESDKRKWDAIRMTMYGFKCDVRILERDFKILEGLVRGKELETEPVQKEEDSKGSFGISRLLWASKTG
ncbi:hypothetical protein TWF718_009241 [Orbilia javanica]|uniref:Uncharacterized protein n=1 Tax=Orbilia javanica TaxID=47235 RepID=A0AAN8N2L2_9PEZI